MVHGSGSGGLAVLRKMIPEPCSSVMERSMLLSGSGSSDVDVPVFSALSYNIEVWLRRSLQNLEDFTDFSCQPMKMEIADLVGVPMGKPKTAPLDLKFVDLMLMS